MFDCLSFALMIQPIEPEGYEQAEAHGRKVENSFWEM